MISIWLIRHGMTAGNRVSRYIGVTDEPLCKEGKEQLEKLCYPVPARLYVSPMLRCRETAEILFPGKEYQMIRELSECDFGEFENKNYQELAGNLHYQQWIDSGGAMPFPGGESREGFQKRCLEGFRRVVQDCMDRKQKTAALVVHGGTIMNIMEAEAEEARTFYEWHLKNGHGYLVEISEQEWMQGIEKVYLKKTYPE